MSVVNALDGIIKRSIGKYSTRSLLAFLFSLLLLATVAFTSFLLIHSANQIVGDVIAETATNISEDVSREVTRFLGTPDIVNVNGARSILAGRIDYVDDDSITRFFMDAPQRRAEYSVSSIYFAEPNGRFIGVEVGGHRKGLDSWDVSISSEKTGGMYTDFKINPDGTVGEKIKEVKPYDPRVRPWYIRALATPERAIWTDVYTDFNTNLATLTRAQAVQSESGSLIGVVAVDLFLEHIQTFLSTLQISENSEAFIINSDGLILAANSPAYNGDQPRHNMPVTETPFRFMPAAVNEIGRLIKVAGTDDFIFKRNGNISRTIELDNAEGYLYSAPIGGEHGVDWTLGIFIPSSDFLTSVDEQMLSVAPLALVGLLLVGAALLIFLSLVIRPLEELKVTANKIAAGEFNTPIDTRMGNEVGNLARSIDSMQRKLQSSFADLETNCQELAKEKCRVETTLRSIADGVISINKHHKIVYMNPTAQALTGWGMDEVKNKDVASIVNVQYNEKHRELNLTEFGKLLDSSQLTEIQGLDLKHKSGSSHPISFSIAPTVNAEGVDYGSVIVFSDLTEKIQMTTELVHQATHDDLTGLVNRREFETQLELALSSDKLSDASHALLYLDMDQFKVVNDTCGHLAGDELLRQVASLFEQCVRTGDIVARLGGDEFGILLHYCSKADGTRIAQKILNQLEKFRFDWEQRSFRLGVSIGLVSIGSEATSVGEVLSDADSACYLAKESGRNRIHHFSEDDESLNDRRNEMQWVDKIDNAIDTDTFVLYAQRIMPTSNHPVPGVHFEVLIRMLDSKGDIIPPGTFLPAAERYNLASKIDRWVIKNTFIWLNEHRDFIGKMGICSINMSGQSIGDQSFIAYITKLLDRYQIPADRICFEVTETATIANLSSAVSIIDALRERGCLFALDDFGTGLSSFAYLKNLHVDYLKIDGVFVRDIIGNDYDLAIVSSINEIGQTLGLKTVAEFVENEQLMEKLEEVGLDFVQGYGVSKPLPIDKLLDVPLKRVA